MKSSTFATLSEILKKSLCLDYHKVVLATDNLFDDLEADSLDTLELTFQIEETFGIKLEREAVFPSWLFYSNNDYVSNGTLTDAGRRRLKNDFTFLDSVQVRKPRELFTVGFLAELIDWVSVSVAV